MEFEGGIWGFQKIMFLYLALAGVTKGLSPLYVSFAAEVGFKGFF